MGVRLEHAEVLPASFFPAGDFGTMATIQVLKTDAGPLGAMQQNAMFGADASLLQQHSGPFCILATAPPPCFLESREERYGHSTRRGCSDPAPPIHCPSPRLGVPTPTRPSTWHYTGAQG